MPRNPILTTHCCSTQGGLFFCFMNRIEIWLIVLCGIPLREIRDWSRICNGGGQDYSLFRKKRTSNSKFFCGPPGAGGKKIGPMKGVFLTPRGRQSLEAIDHVNFWPPSPRRATKKLGIKCAFFFGIYCKMEGTFAVQALSRDVKQLSLEGVLRFLPSTCGNLHVLT